MWSAHATVLLTWAAIYAYVAAFNVLLYLRRRARGEYLALATQGLVLAAMGVAAAVSLGTPSLNVAVRSLQLELACGFVAGATTFYLATELADRAKRWRNPVYALSAVCFVLDVLGLLVEAVNGERAPTSLGMLCALSAAGVAAVSLALMGRGDAQMSTYRWAIGLTLGALLADEVLSYFGRPRLHLIVLIALLPVVAVSHLLLLRFLRDAGQLAEATKALRTSHRDLRIAQEKLVSKEQLAAVGELSAVIAHEVRNPLAIIKNAVSGLRRPTIEASDRSVLLGILTEEVDRLNRLARDLLAYSRPVAPRARAVDMVDVVRKVVERRVETGREPGHRVADVRVDVDDGEVPPVDGDPDLLRQAVNNIVDNALQSMREGGTLVIRAITDPRFGRVVFEFADDGPGMDLATLEKARDPFFTTRPAGTGLGLAIVDRVIANHGGAMEIGSAPNGGTTVTIELPIAHAQTRVGSAL